MKPGRAEARRMAASVMALRECCVWSQWYSEAFGGREGEESPGLVFAQTKAADDGEGCNDRSVPGFGPFEPKCLGVALVGAAATVLQESHGALIGVTCCAFAEAACLLYS